MTVRGSTRTARFGPKTVIISPTGFLGGPEPVFEVSNHFRAEFYRPGSRIGSGVLTKCSIFSVLWLLTWSSSTPVKSSCRQGLISGVRFLGVGWEIITKIRLVRNHGLHHDLCKSKAEEVVWQIVKNTICVVVPGGSGFCSMSCI